MKDLKQQVREALTDFDKCQGDAIVELIEKREDALHDKITNWIVIALTFAGLFLVTASLLYSVY